MLAALILSSAHIKLVISFSWINSKGRRLLDECLSVIHVIHVMNDTCSLTDLVPRFLDVLKAKVTADEPPPLKLPPIPQVKPWVVRGTNSITTTSDLSSETDTASKGSGNVTCNSDHQIRR